MTLETFTVRTEGPVLFADIAAPPMNLLGPELVRDLVTLIRAAEADDTDPRARGHSERDLEEDRAGAVELADAVEREHAVS